jgi:hypothetical protein
MEGEGRWLVIECNSEKEKTEFVDSHLERNQRSVTFPHRLKWPMKYYVTMYGTNCTPHFWNLL